MIFVCIGPDCAGKSSMVKNAAAHFKMDIKNFSYPLTDTTKRRSTENFLDIVEQEGNVIYDRLPLIDDKIYSSILDGVPPYREDFTEAELNALGKAHIFYITASKDVLVSRLKERGDEYITEKDLDDILNAYEDKLNELLFKGIYPEIVDTSKLSLSEAKGYFNKRVFETLNFAKEPKIAHIVPVGCLGITRKNAYHMCLAQNCVSEVYKSFYYERALEGKYVILDNGAAEGTTVTPAKLFDLGNEICASEVILPDFLHDKNATLIAAAEAIEYYRSIRCTLKLMAVPQGVDLKEWLDCAKTLLEYKEIKTIGIPKWLESVEDPYGRYFAVAALEELLKEVNRDDIEIHLLGCNTQPKVIKEIFEAFARVRGCDSAFGYLCAKTNTQVNRLTKRPDAKIDFMSLEKQPDLGLKLLELEKASGIFNNLLTPGW